jgi:chromosomal replication initiator protein
MAILRKKVEDDNIQLKDEILNYIATNIKTNIREIEGALNKLIAYSNIEKTPITMDIAEKELQNIIAPDKPKEITPQLIIEVVADHYGITIDQMTSKNRSRTIAEPRQIAMYLCKEMTDSPLEAIGSFLGGRDHSTIIHGANKVSEQYEQNDAFREQIDAIKKKIDPN